MFNFLKKIFRGSIRVNIYRSGRDYELYTIHRDVWYKIEKELQKNNRVVTIQTFHEDSGTASIS